MRGYHRAGTAPIDTVLEAVNAHTESIISGKMVKVRTTRMMNFLFNGTDCVCCGIKGQYFAVEMCDGHRWGWHLNLYAVDESGSEVLMTRDHAVLKSKGGPDLVSNYKTMCEKCNNLRGSWFDNQDDFLEAYHNGTVNEIIDCKRKAMKDYDKFDCHEHVLEHKRYLKAEASREAEDRRKKEREDFLNSLPRRK